MPLIVVDFGKIKAKYLSGYHNSYSQIFAKLLVMAFHTQLWKQRPARMSQEAWVSISAIVEHKCNFSKEFCGHKLFHLPRKAGQEANAAEIRVQEVVTKAALSAPLHLISFVRLQALKVNPKLRSHRFSPAVGKAGTLVLAFMSCNINLNESSTNKMNCSLQSSLFSL